MIAEKFGKKTGEFVKALILSIELRLFDFMQNFTKKHFAILTTFIAAVLISIICLSSFRTFKLKSEIVKYWHVQSKLEDSNMMNLDSIKSDFLDPFSSILKVDNGLKIAKILYKNRPEDAILILKNIQKYSEKEILESIYMSILAIQIENNFEKRDIKNVQKISTSNSRYRGLAKELLAENELSLNGKASYFSKIKSIYSIEEIKSPHMKERIEELYYIADQGIEN